MHLITNDTNVNHASSINEVFSGADEIIFASAFVKYSAVKQIHGCLSSTLSKGGKVTGYCGTDFFLTEPKALETLYALQAKNGKNCHFYVFDNDSVTFHPKLYVGRYGKDIRCVIGSCNLTSGGLLSNIELSLYVDVKNGSPLEQQIFDYLFKIKNNSRCKDIDLLSIKTYKIKYEKAKHFYNLISRDDVINKPVNIDWSKSNIYVSDWRKNKESQDNMRSRAKKYKEAKEQIDKICAIDNSGAISRKDRREFENCYRNLVTSNGGMHLWQSGDIYRQGLHALEFPSETIDMFRTIKQAAALQPTLAFDTAMDAAQKITGVGVNIVTEALLTYNPSKFAVLNGNTCGSLNFLGLPAPKSLNKKTFKGSSYESFLDTLRLIKKKTKSKTFFEVDSFLNFLYWKYVKKDR